MDISVTDQTGMGEPIPEFADARAEWHALIQQKGAGAFIIPVADVVKYIGEAVVKVTDVPD